jgi:predicted nucleic acid-binding Zn ribbon protein
VQSQGLGAVDLDVGDDATYGSTMSIEAGVRPTEVVTEEATQVLIREARRRQRRRRLIILGVLFVLAIAGWFTARAISTDGSGRVARPLSPKNPDHPIAAAGQFSGFWHVHTTSVTIQKDGQGWVIWPGPLKPGESEATALPGHAELRLTSEGGEHAVALISGSTVPSEVPDGPAQLRVTSQDLLYVIPAHRTAVSPFDPISYGPAGLCGPKAAALALAQVPGGMNCGA